MDLRRLPRKDRQPYLEPIVFTPAALRTARAELALALVHELLDTQPHVPVKLRARLTTVHTKLRRLVQVLRQAEAGVRGNISTLYIPSKTPQDASGAFPGSTPLAVRALSAAAW